MIVYNVARVWFSVKELADKYRVEQGLKPSALLKLDVKDRNDLVSLLNALCDPQNAIQDVPRNLTERQHIDLIDRAYVPASRSIPDCVPDFLLKAHGITRERNKS